MRLRSGDRGEYRLDLKPVGSGGYAQVFSGTHRATNEPVAFKRLINSFGDAVDRMRREIDVMAELSGTAGVMPILDADGKHTWCVMPLADGDLKALREGLSGDELIRAAGEAAAGLQTAHERGFVHRDVTPTNILRMSSSEWVVADWGVVRRPLGMTTRRLTELGKPLGTDGFIAPEVLRDPHTNASAAADVFSLGQVIAFAASGRWPLAGERRLPDGPWRAWVRDAIREDPDSRATLRTLINRLAEVGYQPPEQVPVHAKALADAAAGEDVDAGRRLLQMADAHLDDAEIFFDFLPSVRGAALDELVVDEDMTDRIVGAMGSWLADHRAWGYRNFDDYNSVLGWLHEVLASAQRRGRMGVLEDVADRLFSVGYRLDRWRDRARTWKWLADLQGQEAETVARALRRHPDAAEWLVRDGIPDGAHPDIAAVLGAAPGSQGG